VEVGVDIVFVLNLFSYLCSHHNVSIRVGQAGTELARVTEEFNGEITTLS
jgi:hypothetical protein